MSMFMVLLPPTTLYSMPSHTSWAARLVTVGLRRREAMRVDRLHRRVADLDDREPLDGSPDEATHLVDLRGQAVGVRAARERAHRHVRDEWLRRRGEPGMEALVQGDHLAPALVRDEEDVAPLILRSLVRLRVAKREDNGHGAGERRGHARDER